MTMEIINKVFHNKPRLKSVLNNKKICQKELTPNSFRSIQIYFKIKTRYFEN